MPPQPSESIARRRFQWSVWTIVAPVALVVCVLVIATIVRQAGWLHHAHPPKAARARKPASTTAGGAPSNTAILYRAHKGDTLSDIAVRFGISLDRLHALNPTAPLEKALPASRRIRLR
jgi:LysM domain